MSFVSALSERTPTKAFNCYLQDVSKLPIYQIRLIHELINLFDFEVLTPSFLFHHFLPVLADEEPPHQHQINRDQDIQNDDTDLGRQISWCIPTLN